MGVFFDAVESLLNQALEKTGKSKAKLLGLSGITPSQWDTCIREKRIFSPAMIESLGKSEDFDITEEELEALALIERKGQEKAKKIAQLTSDFLSKHGKENSREFVETEMDKRMKGKEKK